MATTKATDKQVGGNHYKGTAIQHVTFCQRNRIPWCEAAAIKYIIRHTKKNGKEDLEKAAHYIELLIEEDYVREDADNPVGMNIKDFNPTLADFLNANNVPELERGVIHKLVTHQTKHGETTLRGALSTLRSMIRDYHKDHPPAGAHLDGMDLL